MGFFSFLGRVLFASIFILSAWQMYNEFGDDGGPAAKELIPKVALVEKHLSSTLGIKLPTIDARHLAAASVFQKGIGGILFVFGSSLGAYLLLLHLALFTPLLYDFYNYSREQPEYFALLNDFLLNFALFGALLYFLGMKNLIPRRQLKKKAPKAKAA
ncbi:hypothetical protein HS088_TW01G00284 [Tripterygium wilfordii]|uniref:HR-like lesion-inducer n=1 Tax=Tripterygium wilfordii TaxID=458696 RepID=A0A7J7E250_TRIWF|nr:uncharacterized protein LOC119982611 [Tripterygium wilfordii]KAF5752376.1 hypothetical protein HS088_TW01G00284 [Tripterygium wilfordii]